MTWVYDQSDGTLLHDGKPVPNAVGYAGKGAHKNRPASENLKNLGPIPKGQWLIGGYTNSKGPLTITLTPNAGTNTFGRTAFRIHGDSIKNPGTASEGCIIMPYSVRTAIINSGDHDLEVVE
ncbi:tlde1 domain-containing protein [Nitrogeniibacter aestuarii]|uniref:tlde1 domain-containing protein n=1 Tax=Nitrogeniibacter aestuarii TaxID=2815343 RepID=UPI001E519BB3|nr:tlde1 domain-containing protein [Nitrogeniibacter aestuarii]